MGITTALIDGDILLYRCGFSAQTKVVILSNKTREIGRFPGIKAMMEWVSHSAVSDDISLDDVFSYESVVVPKPFGEAVRSLDDLVKNIVGFVGARDYRFFITGEGNFREEIATIKPYKGNRSDNRKPYWYTKLKEHVINSHDAEVIDGFEADDALGWNQTDETVICTIDKDLLMVEGNHYNFVSGKKQIVKPYVGMIFFLRQLLTGDSTDNIQGCPGAGPVKANATVGSDLNFEQNLTEVYSLYYEHYGNHIEAEAAIRENGNLLWMQRTKGVRWTDERFHMECLRHIIHNMT